MRTVERYGHGAVGVVVACLVEPVGLEDLAPGVLVDEQDRGGRVHGAVRRLPTVGHIVLVALAGQLVVVDHAGVEAGEERTHDHVAVAGSGLRAAELSIRLVYRGDAVSGGLFVRQHAAEVHLDIATAAVDHLGEKAEVVRDATGNDDERDGDCERGDGDASLGAGTREVAMGEQRRHAAHAKAQAVEGARDGVCVSSGACGSSHAAYAAAFTAGEAHIAARADGVHGGHAARAPRRNGGTDEHRHECQQGADG